MRSADSGDERIVVGWSSDVAAGLPIASRCWDDDTELGVLASASTANRPGQDVARVSAGRGISRRPVDGRSCGQKRNPNRRLQNVRQNSQSLTFSQLLINWQKQTQIFHKLTESSAKMADMDYKVPFQPPRCPIPPLAPQIWQVSRWNCALYKFTHLLFRYTQCSKNSASITTSCAQQKMIWILNVGHKTIWLWDLVRHFNRR